MLFERQNLSWTGTLEGRRTKSKAQLLKKENLVGAVQKKRQYVV